MIRSLDEDSDARTQFTASDAMICKFSSSSKGYFEDPFLLKMIHKDASLSTKPQQLKKPPIINRGYYARVQSIHQIIDKFINAPEFENGLRKQIISLGSGFDTLSLQLLQRGDKDLHIYEVDFEEIIQQKVKTFLSEPSIERLLKSPEQNKNSDSAKSGIYLDHEKAKYDFDKLHFLSGDLRNSDEVLSELQEAGLEIRAPTLILTECVLVYIKKQESESLCSAFSGLLDNCCWVTYDMVTPTDTFGKTMLKNLTTARFSIPGFIDYPTLESQEGRFLENGWDQAKSVTMFSVYNDQISPAERHRIARLEIFDEIEEWQMLMSHYTLTVAGKGSFFTLICL